MYVIMERVRERERGGGVEREGGLRETDKMRERGEGGVRHR